MPRFAVSNIAWEPHQNEQALKLLKDNGIDFLEVAPTKLISEWIDFTPENWNKCKEELFNDQVKVSSFQALSFKKADLEIFHTEESRRAYIEHIKFVIDLAYELLKEPKSVSNCVNLVFGAPKTRDPRGKTFEECLVIATQFFKELGEYCISRHLELGLSAPESDRFVPAVTVCLEPNPKDYGCFFGYNIEQASKIVRETDSMGFRLHIDTACLTMAGDNLYQSIIDNSDIMQHFHVSEPQLGKFINIQCDHERASKALKEIGYDKVISIEMRSNGEDSLNELNTAIDFVKRIYN